LFVRQLPVESRHLLDYMGSLMVSLDDVVMGDEVLFEFLRLLF